MGKKIVDINSVKSSPITQQTEKDVENIIKNATDAYNEIEQATMRVMTSSISLPPVSPGGANVLNNYLSITKEQAQTILSRDKFTDEDNFKKATGKVKEKGYIKKDYDSSIFKARDKKVTAEWLLSIKLLGIALNKTNSFLENITKSELKEDEKNQLFEKINLLNNKQIELDARATTRPTANFFKKIIDGDPSTGNIIDEVFPTSGSGLKRGRGLASNLNQLISRTENLISGAQLGNKSRELFNELDSNLQVLIDKKKITKIYRDNLMKKLFF